MRKYMKKIRKALVMLAVITVIAMFPVTANASTNWKKGGFSGGAAWSSWHYVTAEEKLDFFMLPAKHYFAKNPTLYVYCYKSNGKKYKAKNSMKIEIYSTRTKKCVYSGTIKCGQKIKLKAWNGPLGAGYFGSDGLKQLRKDNTWKIRIRSSGKSTPIEWWAIKAVNGIW